MTICIANILPQSHSYFYHIFIKFLLPSVLLCPATCYAVGSRSAPYVQGWLCCSLSLLQMQGRGTPSPVHSEALAFPFQAALFPSSMLWVLSFPPLQATSSNLPLYFHTLQVRVHAPCRISVFS